MAPVLTRSNKPFGLKRSQSRESRPARLLLGRYERPSIGSGIVDLWILLSQGVRYIVKILPWSARSPAL